MGSVVVVVDVPNFKGLCALLLRGPYPGIPELLTVAEGAFTAA
jgi:hypothetical protein